MTEDLATSDTVLVRRERPIRAQSVRILGVPISAIDMSQTLFEIDTALAIGRGGYICVRDAHGVLLAQNDPYFRDIHDRAALVTPDGMPLVWLAHLYGHSDVDRVCGADLVTALCAHSLRHRYRHYLFGGTADVAERLRQALRSTFPGIQIAGCESPPFKPPTTEPDYAACERIRDANADIVWVGLGTPKQEYWMAANAPLLPNAILIGVGAAFDFHAGAVKRAPCWMQRSGLEWLYRLHQQPRRLWKRYLITVPKFTAMAFAEWIHFLKTERSQ